MGYLCAGSLTLADALGIRFAVLFKLPSMLASVATVFLLWRAGVSSGMLLLFALNPVDILISGFHANTDSLCAAFALLSALLLERRRPGLSGLALAAALNVKLIPVVLILPFVFSLARKEALRFTLGVTAGVLPFVPFLVEDPASLYRRVLSYSSSIYGRGIHLPFILDQRQLPASAARLYLLFLASGKYVILAASAVLALLNRRWRVWNAYELAAIAFSVFLVLAPGFGYHWLVYPLAFFVASRPKVAVEYSLLATAFLLLVYSLSWEGECLVATERFKAVRGFPHLTGFLAWYVLLRYIVVELYDAVRTRISGGAR